MGTVAKNIKQLRELSGLSQNQLANRLGITRSAVSYYESGRITPKMAILEKLAAVFGVSVADLVYDGEAVFEISDSMTEAEYNLLRNFRALTPAQRASVVSLVESMAQ